MAMLIRNATPQDVPEILRLIRALADYEKLSHEVVATQERLRECLFGLRPMAETVLAHVSPTATIEQRKVPDFP
jgi:hypothetical protein